MGESRGNPLSICALRSVSHRRYRLTTHTAKGTEMPSKVPILTPDWMRVAEAAARMDCTPITVRKRLRRGSIPVRWTVIEGTIHLNRKHFIAWVEGEKSTKAVTGP